MQKEQVNGTQNSRCSGAGIFWWDLDKISKSSEWLDFTCYIPAYRSAATLLLCIMFTFIAVKKMKIKWILMKYHPKYLLKQMTQEYPAVCKQSLLFLIHFPINKVRASTSPGYSEIHSHSRVTLHVQCSEINRNTTTLNCFHFIEGKVLLRVRDLEKTVLKTFLRTCSHYRTGPAFVRLFTGVFPWY